MANFTVLQNGKVKVQRGRFGGDSKRLVDDYGKTRRDILSEIAASEAYQDISTSHKLGCGRAVAVASFEPLCPITGQVRPDDGIVHGDVDSGVTISVTYKDGRIQSAHVRSDRDPYHNLR